MSADVEPTDLRVNSTMLFYTRDLSVCGFWYIQGLGGGRFLDPFPCGYGGTTVLLKLECVKEAPRDLVQMQTLIQQV